MAPTLLITLLNAFKEAGITLIGVKNIKGSPPRDSKHVKTYITADNIASITEHEKSETVIELKKGMGSVGVTTNLTANGVLRQIPEAMRDGITVTRLKKVRQAATPKT